MSGGALQDGAIKTADTIISGVVYNIAVEAALAEIFAVAPWLLPLKWVIAFFVRRVAARIFSSLQTKAAFVIIDIQTTRQKEAFNTAVGSYNTAPSKDNEDVLKAALAKLIHFDNR